ncbi:MAG: radical SAM protein [Candidatus Acididesulfobacter diazotrophicus]|jgi:radical SAM protein with 4Fe4S-binding SPASM domain|uniref:Radical SAM protein n=1 Tax=Candidatus Acididesulfobacter diazotrophicus TaxID=2597226 RepID=A0A519BQH1_9DELT|nr:MAG: radical SAM protein [Candidatus Acididesulfobacter diazotrophicus]
MDKYSSKGENEFYIQWHFIESCNLRCVHCYQEDYVSKGPDLEQLRLIFSRLDEAMAKWNTKGVISLTGGEPFLKPTNLFYLASLIENSSNFKDIAILSNGTLIDDNLIAEIKKYKKITEIQISLDGADAKTHEAIRGEGTFLKTVNSIKKLKEAGIKTSIMFTLNSKNIGSAVNMSDLAYELNADTLTVERMTTMSEAEKNEFFIQPQDLKKVYSDVYVKSKKVFSDRKTKLAVSRPLWNLVDENIGGYCPVGLSSICILHDGTVLPCRRLYLPIGNIIDDGLFKIWYTSKVLWEMRKKNNLSKECLKCSHFERCGGCKAMSYYYHNDFNAKDPQCWI